MIQCRNRDLKWDVEFGCATWNRDASTFHFLAEGHVVLLYMRIELGRSPKYKLNIVMQNHEQVAARLFGRQKIACYNYC